MFNLNRWPSPKDQSSVSSSEEVEKNKIKKSIENALSKIKEDAFSHLFKRAMERAIRLRMAFEVLKKYEETPEEAIEKFSIGKHEENSEKIFVNTDSVIKNFWVPKKFMQKNKGDFEGILANDEINSLGLCLSEEEEAKNKVLFDEVLYGKRPFGESGQINENRKKIDLFFNDKKYRDAARKYIISALDIIREYGERGVLGRLPEKHKKIFQKEGGSFSDTELSFFRAMEDIAVLYLEEIEQENS